MTSLVPSSLFVCVYMFPCLQFQQQGSDIMNAARPNMTHEAWVVISSQFMGDGVASGAFRQLTNLAALDTRLNLPGTIRTHTHTHTQSFAHIHADKLRLTC